MKTLFDATTNSEMINRIEKLTPSSHRQWGKMNVSQMLVHCTNGIEMAMGTRKMKPIFIGRIIGRFFKAGVLNDQPMKKSTPTVKEMVIVNTDEFETEKQRLINVVKAFNEAGKNGIPVHDHPFFGKMTTDEWGISATKHLDHHLGQFNV